MRLYEHKSKEILSKYGVPVPKGILTSSSSVQFQNFQFPVVVKAQVLVGGRGKSGGVRFADSPSEAKEIIGEMIGLKVKEVNVQEVLIEEKVDVSKELYLSISLDRDHSTTLLMASEYGGIDVEDIEPEKMFRVEVNPLIGIQTFTTRKLLEKISLAKNVSNQITVMVQKLYEIFNDYDALLVEINPVGITRQGEAMALDAKILLDANAIFRHPEFQGLDRGTTEFENRTSELGVNGVEIKGDIGVIASGAGCLMATMDSIKAYGGKLAASIDLGGSVFNIDQINSVISSCVSEMKKLRPKVILFNAYFQLARCDVLAQAIRSSLSEGDEIPVVVRLKGRADSEAEKVLSDVPNVFFRKSFGEACEKAVKLAVAGD